MRNWIAVLALLAACLAPAAQAVTLVDRIVAVVNKEVITYSELNEAVGMAERQMRRQGTPSPERAVLERQMLERLILDRAQAQMARDTGIRIDELQLDRAVQRIAQSNNMTLADFRAALERDGLAYDTFRKEVREQIALSRLREREVDDRIQVSDSEIDLFLEAMSSAPAERIEAAKTRAERVRADALAGNDFAKLAASFSDAPDALRGGAARARRRRWRRSAPRR